MSAGSAAQYLAGEVQLPFPTSLLPLFMLVLFSGVCLLGIRESSGVALTIISFHLITMIVLALTSIVRWGINGNSVLVENWTAAQPGSASEIARQIFYGVSLGFLGNTGTSHIPKTKERFRIDCHIRGGSSSEDISQGFTESLAHVIHSIDYDDVACLGSRPVHRRPTSLGEYPIPPRGTCRTSKMATILVSCGRCPGSVRWYLML